MDCILEYFSRQYITKQSWNGRIVFASSMIFVVSVLTIYFNYSLSSELHYHQLVHAKFSSRHRLLADQTRKIDKTLLHLTSLNEACLFATDSIIPWFYDSPEFGTEQLYTPKSQNILQYLSECPDVDVFLPSGLRSHGYCEDAMAYVKYLKSRALPTWVFDNIFTDGNGSQFTYFDLCPSTPVILMNHYWDGLPDRTSWPKSKKIILMPNIEMYELRENHLHRADIVLCKTNHCEERVTAWYQQEGNPKNTKVLLTKHTSSDIATLAHWSYDLPVRSTVMYKDFNNLTFLHTNGNRYAFLNSGKAK